MAPVGATSPLPNLHAFLLLFHLCPLQMGLYLTHVPIKIDSDE